jgi:hypothetical protein
MLQRFPVESKGRRKKLNEVLSFIIGFYSRINTLDNLHF